MEGVKFYAKGSNYFLFEGLQGDIQGLFNHVVRVKDLECEILSIVSVPLVREFLEVFANDLPGVYPEQEIDFGIDLLPDRNPISILEYRMVQDELKELKLQLKDLLD